MSWTMMDVRTIPKKTTKRRPYLRHLSTWNLRHFHRLCFRKFLPRPSNGEPAAERCCAAVAAKWRCVCYAAIQECVRMTVLP